MLDDSDGESFVESTVYLIVRKQKREEEVGVLKYP
jgi:hypothetical protein